MTPDTTMIGLFGVTKPLIGVVHLLALPGSAAFDRASGMARIIDAARADVHACQDAGVDAMLFCNEGDLPYRIGVGQETVAAAAAVIGRLASEISIPYGVDLYWDAGASIALARAVDACFVRQVFVGVYESDMGQLRAYPGPALAYRHSIGADDIAVFTNLTPEFASPLGSRSVAARAEGAQFFGITAALISGPRAGKPFLFANLEEAKQAVPMMPVLANTGVRHDTVERILETADGVIVGTSLKVDGRTENRIDLDRARRMVTNVRVAREHHLERLAAQTRSSD
jgi:uncharacterized protein